jgi:hypothetical protein
MGLKLRSLSLNLPFGLGGVEVDVTEAEARAAWELYVEFATRVTAHPLEPGAGSPEEALNSLHYLFGVTREVLRGAGPEVGQGPDSLGPLAIDVLNTGLRPFLVRWHTVLRQSGAELDAARRGEFDAELADLRKGLAEYVDALALIAGVKD